MFSERGYVAERDKMVNCHKRDTSQYNIISDVTVTLKTFLVKPLTLGPIDYPDLENDYICCNNRIDSALVPARGKSQQLHETSTLPKVVGDCTLRLGC